MDKRLLYFKPNLEGRESLDPKTIEDGTPILAVDYESTDSGCRHTMLCVFRAGFSESNSFYDCHCTYFQRVDGAVFFTYRDSTLPPMVHQGLRFADNIRGYGNDVSGIAYRSSLKFYSMTDEEKNILGSVLNSFHLIWDMETLQLIDCDTHEVLSAAERPPQPVAPKPEYNPIITREALLAMEGCVWNYKFNTIIISPKRHAGVISFKFRDGDWDVPCKANVINGASSVYIVGDSNITWVNLLLAIKICIPDYESDYPLDRFVRQIPIQLTITETRKQ